MIVSRFSVGVGSAAETTAAVRNVGNQATRKHANLHERVAKGYDKLPLPCDVCYGICNFDIVLEDEYLGQVRKLKLELAVNWLTSVWWT